MGERYEFVCGDCGYSATVSGGKDRGFVAFIETMVCTDCKKLVDVLVGEAKEFSGPLGKSEGEEFGKCPVCSGKNVKPWDAKERSCPKCGKQMHKGDEPVLMWD